MCHVLVFFHRLTVTDAQGSADSATALVSVAKQRQDGPPVANAGPDEFITLPLDHLVLRGNQSSDDQGVNSYLWTLHPSTQNKVVTMQVPWLLCGGKQSAAEYSSTSIQRSTPRPYQTI